MKKYNLSKIMKRAWEIVRKLKNTFAEALKMAWKIAKFERHYLDTEGGTVREGRMTFNIWEGYGYIRAYFTASWESRYQNGKRRFLDLI